MQSADVPPSLPRVFSSVGWAEAANNNWAMLASSVPSTSISASRFHAPFMYGGFSTVCFTARSNTLAAACPIPPLSVCAAPLETVDSTSTWVQPSAIALGRGMPSNTAASTRRRPLCSTAAEVANAGTAAEAFRHFFRSRTLSKSSRSTDFSKSRSDATTLRGTWELIIASQLRGLTMPMTSSRRTLRSSAGRGGGSLRHWIFFEGDKRRRSRKAPDARSSTYARAPSGWPARKYVRFMAPAEDP
mmetsp:Transcript_4495/g.9170  ORF Transcript_4495/g.9170 Transcript_4495/m.9170 type:complete len:245 (-) Transcript_4495:84-818(-)